MLYINQLTKQYKNFSLNCSMELPQGRITGLIGQNGAGKSTLLKSILGLISYDSGSVTLFGKKACKLTPQDREALGVSLSDSGFSSYLTVKDLRPILKNLYHHFDALFFEEQLKRFELPINKKIQNFSTGMKAKLKLLVALSHRAKLLILDEPTAGLDVVTRDEMLLLLREYMEQDESRSILISSHISSDLEPLCDDLYMLHNGEIILHEETDVLLDSYAILKADPEQYNKMDKGHLLYRMKESFGYSCLTDQKQYYMENEPSIVLEKASIDRVITMLIKGEKI